MFPLMMQNREMFQSFVGANADLTRPEKNSKATIQSAALLSHYGVSSL